MQEMWWWKRCPKRLEYELQALRDAGIAFELDEKAKAFGIVRLELQVVHDGSAMPLVATFPDLYPYFRFEVEARDLNLGHHQNPFGKNLCFIGRNTVNWKTTDTLAAYIQDRLPLVIRAATTADKSVAEALEEHQGEPVSTYYQYRANTILLIDSSWSIPAGIKKGNLVIGLSGLHVGHVVRGAIQEVRTSEGKVLASADPALNRLYPKVIHGRWYRILKPAVGQDALLLLKSHAKEHPSISQTQSQKINGWEIDIIGLVFSDELTYGEKADDWIFVVRAQRSTAGQKVERESYLIRAGRAGRSDLAARIPELAILSKRRVALIGLGGIGAPVAIELARSGVGELRILDQDIIEPGTSVRWPLGLASAGQSKAEALRDFIGVHYPFTTVLDCHHSIGRTFIGRMLPSPSQVRDPEILEMLVDGVDLVYDATAEVGIQYLLSDLAAAKSIPYICASTTVGAWGGLLARIRPGKTEGCWSCLQGQLDGSIPSPPQSPSGMVQPKGCADPTFTGIGCDVANIALMGVRLAIATMCSDVKGAYPDFKWDVAVCALRDPDGQALAPQWKTFPLSKSLKCLKCMKP